MPPNPNSALIHSAPDCSSRPVRTSTAPPEVHFLRTTSDRDAQADTFTFARATPSDLSTIAKMIERCSVDSRRRRFFRPLPSAPPGYLEEVLADPDTHHAFVVKHDQETVGFAELHCVGRWSGSLALIIEDAYQHRGAGSAALQVLVRHSRKIGVRTLTADLLFENNSALHALRRVGPASVDLEDGIVHIEIDLESDRGAASTAPRVSSPPRHTVRSSRDCPSI
jgi:RimJ/RimL family protein N-acetyltransferase